MSKKVYLKYWGCQMNVRDSEVICGLLAKEGYRLVDEPKKADVIIFNTCSVRQHAEDKVWSEIGRYKKTSGAVPLDSNSRALTGTVPIIGVVGCMAQSYKEEIFDKAPNVSFVVGPSDIYKITDIIQKLTPEERGQPPLFQRKIWETDSKIRPEEIYHTGFYEDKEHAYVVISEGCSNFCSYCVVPYVRGALRNRNYKDILKEIQEATDLGITKITLLGQNVNAYISSVKRKAQSAKLKLSRTDGIPPNVKSMAGKTQNLNRKVNFVDLLKMVNEIKGLKEFSFVTSHPKDTSVELFKAMADCEKLKKYLHLPVQSGSDRILELMSRGYTRKFYLDLADNYRKIVKNGSLTTDIIVGFPTETERDFQDTHDLVSKIAFNAAFIFKYSPRPHTEAARMYDDVAKEEKERRHKIILDLQRKISKTPNYGENSFINENS